MLRKLFKKVIGGLLVSLLVFANFANVYAATLSVTMGNITQTESSLSLWMTESGVPLDTSEGYVRMKVLSVTGNLIKVELKVSTEATDGKTPLPISGATGTVWFDSNIYSNFDITVAGQEGIEYRPQDNTIQWIIGDMPASTTKTVVYNLEPKADLNPDIMSDSFLVAKEFIVTHNSGLNTVKFDIKENNDFCIPFVGLAMTDNPPTGLFTDIIILSAIIVGAAGILIITLKNNRFVKI